MPIEWLTYQGFASRSGDYKLRGTLGQHLAWKDVPGFVFVGNQRRFPCSASVSLFLASRAVVASWSMLAQVISPACSVVVLEHIKTGALTQVKADQSFVIVMLYGESSPAESLQTVRSRGPPHDPRRAEPDYGVSLLVIVPQHSSKEEAWPDSTIVGKTALPRPTTYDPPTDRAGGAARSMFRNKVWGHQLPTTAT
ncbi:uncharacterized protein B0I36DRAFT_413767 [Microdochium trichocladiopsis]|uniref:Uncharacterized protein n=1 Tax=Microdochium trichocladiopsis TaxID=1682393 RepID=A0A9P9BNW8_9PEZI|nr:uncharacterized protein B0I36DRAFT_413767 [Microdochium trichocladiopsis]KAH7028163.1 hypothetical protein B0I36DRAFT_413767 [Microdochium trichocladiopsis]